MSTSHIERIPALTLGWRLKMALSDSELNRDDMAHELGVTPSTISRWMSDKGKPPARAYVVRWSQLTGVSLPWLESGVVVSDPDPGGGERVASSRQGDAVASLAARKRSRYLHHSGTTDGYLDFTAAA